MPPEDIPIENLGDKRNGLRIHDLDDLFGMMRTLMDGFVILQKDFVDLRNEMKKHVEIEDRIFGKQNAELQKLSNLVKAFPKRKEDGLPDIEGHHNDHVTRMQDAESSSAFWRRIRIGMAEKLIWGTLLVVLFLVVLGVRDEVVDLIKKPPTNTQVIQGIEHGVELTK